MPRFALITPVWKRPRLTRLFIDYWRPLTAARHYHLYAISPEDPYARLYGDEILKISVPNTPLHEKHNALSERLKRADIDALLVMPSDDFFTPSYLDAMAWALDQGYDSVQTDMLWFYCTETGRMLKGLHMNVGAGFMVRADVAVRAGWRLWATPTGQQGPWMDYLMLRGIGPHVRNGLRIANTLDYGGPPYAGMDVKGSVARNGFTTLWDFLTYQERYTGDMTEVFLREAFPGIAERLLNWNQEQRRVA